MRFFKLAASMSMALAIAVALTASAQAEQDAGYANLDTRAESAKRFHVRKM